MVACTSATNTAVDRKSAVDGAAEGSLTGSGVPALFFLDILGNRVLRASPDGGSASVVVDKPQGVGGPDGVAVDAAHGYIYWTNMGVPNANDGTVLRANLDGSNVTTIVPSGGTFTPKELELDAATGTLYWSDREGMRVFRGNVDGTSVEPLVVIADGDAARADASNWAVGVAVDTGRRQIYWTQKGGDNAGLGSIRRASLDIPSGETAATRTDIEVLFSGLPEPIDLGLDLAKRQMYWTDRGNPPDGNTVNVAPMDPPAGASPASRTDRTILVHGLAEGIGISLDLPHDRMFFTDLGGTVYVSNLDGTEERSLLTAQGSLTGITYVELPGAH
jgi:DNA-binding beta-propeller fold protein YncE